MISFRNFLWTSFALVFLGLSWLWDHLNRLIGWLIDLVPLENFKRAVLRFMDGLAPYPTLAVFSIPFIVTEPMKLASFWLFAQYQILAGLALYIVAELIKLALVAFIFNACKDKLLSIRWFAELYKFVLRVHDWADQQVAPIKLRAKQILAEIRVRVAHVIAPIKMRLRQQIAVLWANIRNR